MDLDFDLNALPTPYYTVDEALLVRNLEILKAVSDKTGCRILLAQKAFSMFYFYPLIGRYLCGTAASGLFEAKLGHEALGGETHIFSPAYRDSEFGEITDICDHIVFNSFSQLDKFRGRALGSGRSIGLRINPECSTQEHGIYDPCSPGSRLGVTLKNLQGKDLSGIDGLHFHTLCEQNADALAETLSAVEENFGQYLKQMKWVNFGGGHHITRADYDIPLLIDCIDRVQNKYDVQVYLEPGEAVALNTGYLVTCVIDIVENGLEIAVLDASAACHMPDVLEMPYRPNIAGAGIPGEKKYTYRLGGPTCLAGDIIGDYSFDKPLCPGDRLVFCDMAHYTMVKNNTFNGICLPAIAAVNKDRQFTEVQRFGYEDFKHRLS
ncbi:MAG: carboxynorspermidine decarboxylase [Oscillospiraceae bacterium]